MFRAIVRLVLVIGVGAGGGALLLGQQRPVFRTDVNFVTVDAYPLIDGRVVEGLTLADFEVREDGRPQHVESFEYVRADARLTEAERREPDNQREMLDQLVDPRARVFVAFLDANNVGISGAFYSRLPLMELFDRILAPSDLIALTTSRNPPGELTFGRKSTVVRQQLSDFWTWQDPDVTVNDAEESMVSMCYPKDPDVGNALVARRRQDQLFSNLEGLVEYLGEVREGRKTVFLFSAGWTWFVPDEGLLKVLNRPDYVPPIGVPITNEPWRNLRAVTSLAEGSKATCETELRRLAALNSPPRFRDLLRRATVNNVVFYPVNPSGVGAIGERNDRLMELASNTGGTAVSNRNDLVQGIVDVSREFAGYYLLGYAADHRPFDRTLRPHELDGRPPGVGAKGFFAACIPSNSVFSFLEGGSRGGAAPAARPLVTVDASASGGSAFNKNRNMLLVHGTNAAGTFAQTRDRTMASWRGTSSTRCSARARRPSSIRSCARWRPSPGSRAQEG